MVYEFFDFFGGNGVDDVLRGQEHGGAFCCLVMNSWGVVGGI
jgi:hypothetical protein